MRIDLDAKVRTSDGEDAGSVQRAVVDPRSNEVTELVVSTGALFGRDVLVPRTEIDRATADGDAIRLGLTKEELERLPTYAPVDYTAPPAGWVPPVGYGFPYGAYAWPVTLGAAHAPPPYPTTPATAATPPAAGAAPDVATLGKGALVVDRDGDDVGVVDDVRFDAANGQVRGFVLRVGGALRTLFGGGDTVELAAADVERVSEGLVYLKRTKDELERAGRPR